MNCIVLISLGSDFTPCMPPLLLLLLFASTYSCHMILSIILSQPPFFVVFDTFRPEESMHASSLNSQNFWILRNDEKWKKWEEISRFDKVLIVTQLCDSLKQTTYFLRSCYIFTTPIFSVVKCDTRYSVSFEFQFFCGKSSPWLSRLGKELSFEF